MLSSALRLRKAVTGVLALSVLSCGPDRAGIQRLPLEPEVAPAVLTVSPSAATLPYIGATERLSASVKPDGSAAGLDFQWWSTVPGVATVAGDGTVTAVAEGEAKIVVRVLNLVDTATVTVKRLPAAISLDPDSLLFTELGATASITAGVTDGAGEALPASEILWTTSDSAVATVSGTGAVTAVGQGSTTVKATAGGVVASVKVRVAVGPATLEVDPAAVDFAALGDTVRLTATVLDAAGGALEGIDITYLVDDSAVATVDSTGLVTARGPGETSVAVSGDTVRTIVMVEVDQEPASVSVTPDSVRAAVGATVSYSATVLDANDSTIASPFLVWSTTDAAVATVTSGGEATAVAAGTVGIVATAGSVADTATLEVVVPVVDTLDIAEDSVSLVEGTTTQLTVTLMDSTLTVLVGAQATWTADDTAVATVDADGLVTGVAPGNTWVRAQADSAVDSTFVEVTQSPSQFDVEVRFIGTAPAANIQAAFDAAEARWEEIIRGDLSDVSIDVDSADCGIAHPAVNEVVDDVVIFVEVDSIDGVGNVLAQAGPCLVRTVDGLAALGTMQMDEADLNDLDAQGLLDETVAHEMGHVLGFGTGNPWEETLVDKGGADPYWPGTQAVAEYQNNGGTATNAVPVENTGGQGTQDAHWRESDMGRELMTGFLDSGSSNPLSSITIGAMEDMGYEVDLTKADAYTVSPLLRAAPGRTVRIKDVVLAPRFAVDAGGVRRIER